MKVRIGAAKLEVVQGDITDQTVDAVVNAANNHLWMGAGVAGAIKRRGGQIIEDSAVAQAPIDIGAAVLTTGGDLPANYVIHGAAMGQDLQTDEFKILKTTTSCLEVAVESSLASVAFPALGTGVGGFSAQACAQIMIDAVVEFLQQPNSLRKVVFVLFDNHTFQAFEAVMSAMFRVPNE
jgi:O-acetyl-ADP-ribose deacetylase